MCEMWTASDAVHVPCVASMTCMRYGQVVHRVGHGFCGELQCNARVIGNDGGAEQIVDQRGVRCVVPVDRFIVGQVMPVVEVRRDENASVPCSTAMLIDERDDRIVERLRRIAMRRVSAIVELRQLGVRRALRNRIDLRHRAVVIVVALYGKQWAAYAIQFVDDGP